MGSSLEDSIEELEQEEDAAAEDAETSEWPDHEEETLADDPDTDTSDSSVGMSDDELAELVESRSTDITVVGCGGAGSNTINRMLREGIDGATMYAANTDAQHLYEVEADNKILLGGTDSDGVQGRGAGSLPQVGEKAAMQSQGEIRGAVQGSDMVFVTAGLGGGTGTGAAPVVAKEAHDAGALTIAIVSTPFTAEGEVRRTNAEAGLARLRQVTDTVIVVPNDRLLDTVGNMPLDRAFKVCDEVLMRSVKGITELITESGLVNLDFSDVRTVMENGDVAMIGLGESSSENRSLDSVKDALSSPLLDVDISGANSVLVNVTGGESMSIEEAEGVVEQLYDRVDPDARIIWGAAVDEDLDDTMQTMLVVTGVESPQIHGDETDEGEEDSNGIDHIE